MSESGNDRRSSQANSLRRNQNRKRSCWEKTLDLDDIFVNELGQFGWFQLRILLLVAICIIAYAFSTEYVFSAAPISHRCRIPECGEDSKSVEFRPDWIWNAIPTSSGNNLASCERFQPIRSNGTLDYCPESLFNQDHTIRCDGFVYEKDNSVVYDFDLGCEEWLRALAGTLSNFGTLLALPLSGYISDNYGRHIALVVNIFNLALFGLIRAFSVNYPMYLVFQLLQTTFGSGVYSSAYIFATEFVGPKWRVLTSATCSSMFAIGLVVLGGVAWLIQPWRHMILVLHIPCFLIVSYYWLLPESVRWLLSKQKYDEARKVLENIAKVNNKEISEKCLVALANQQTSESSIDVKNRPNLFKTIIKSPVLLRRVCTTPFWWVTTTLVYYGLSINVTVLSGDIYFNFILVSLIEIPGHFTAVLVLDRIGRKATLSVCYFLCAGCNIAFAFISEDYATLRLVLYLLGKFSIAAVFTSLYLYTSELYPTEYRHTLLGFSSAVGRIGSISAPLTPVLANYWPGLPSLIFATMAIASGLLVLTQPETVGLSLPDTLAESESIGTKNT